MQEALAQQRMISDPGFSRYPTPDQDAVGRPEIFAIPFAGKMIIYAPLKRLAFLGNIDLAELIGQLVEGRRPDQNSATLSQAIDFVKQTGILVPDPVLVENGSLEVYRPGGTTLFLTNRCNLRCIYCYADAGSERPLNMPLDLALQAVDLVCRNAIKRGLPSFEVGFHGGGEPTLNWKVLKSTVQAARKKSLPAVITMSSNGCYTKEKLVFILEHFTGLSLSFDGPPEIQDRQRPKKDGSSSFKEVMKTIAALDGKNFNYGIRITAVPDTIAKLPTIVEFLSTHTAVKRIQVEPAFARGRGKQVAVAARGWQHLYRVLQAGP